MKVNVFRLLEVFAARQRAKLAKHQRAVARHPNSQVSAEYLELHTSRLDAIAASGAAIQELIEAGDFMTLSGPTDGALRRWQRAKRAVHGG